MRIKINQAPVDPHRDYQQRGKNRRRGRFHYVAKHDRQLWPLAPWPMPFVACARAKGSAHSPWPLIMELYTTFQAITGGPREPGAPPQDIRACRRPEYCRNFITRFSTPEESPLQAMGRMQGRTGSLRSFHPGCLAPMLEFFLSAGLRRIHNKPGNGRPHLIITCFKYSIAFRRLQHGVAP